MSICKYVLVYFLLKINILSLNYFSLLIKIIDKYIKVLFILSIKKVKEVKVKEVIFYQ